MFDIKAGKKLLEGIVKYEAKMDALMDDFTEEGEKKFDDFCEKRDELLDKLIEMLGIIGIDAPTSRAMILNSKNREKLVAIFGKAC